MRTQEEEAPFDLTKARSFATYAKAYRDLGAALARNGKPRRALDVLRDRRGTLLPDEEELAAAELGVTPKTVSFHLQKIYEKLQVHSKSEAVAKALRNRLVR